MSTHLQRIRHRHACGYYRWDVGGKRMLAQQDVGALLAEIDRLTPRTVTTAAELDALPVGSVVLDRHGRLLKSKDGVKGIRGWKFLEPTPGLEAIALMDGCSMAFPAAVLHEGGAS